MQDRRRGACGLHRVPELPAERAEDQAPLVEPVPAPAGVDLAALIPDAENAV